MNYSGNAMRHGDVNAASETAWDTRNTVIISKKFSNRAKKFADNLYRKWREVILESYGYRDLSQASDKLPATSGVAEALRVKLGDKYLAGL